jgi:A/G-specific adenine glycosylase
VAPGTGARAPEAGADGGVRDPEQPRRAYDSLIADGLVVELDGRARLP